MLMPGNWVCCLIMRAGFGEVRDKGPLSRGTASGLVGVRWVSAREIFYKAKLEDIKRKTGE